MTAVHFEAVGKRFANGVRAVRELTLHVESGELLVLVGPSGCGKTTTIRMLAGLEDPTSGTISLDERVVNDISARDRNIAMVFQSYALYPHMSVADNIGYPLRMAKLDKSERAARVAKVASQLRLEKVLETKPAQLSGGQRQRVAMGRAMVRKPAVFLMDEPLSNLDAQLRVALRAELAELQRSLGTTMLYVTHDQVEAMTMGHRVAVMHDGELQQADAPAELYANPANTFVASFVGTPPMNLIEGSIMAADDGFVGFQSSSMWLPLSDHRPPSLTPGAAAVLGIRPEHLRLTSNGPIAGRVELVEVLGGESLVHVGETGADFHSVETTLEADDEKLRPSRIVVRVHDASQLPRIGDAVCLDVDAAGVRWFNRSSGLAVRALAS